MVSAAHAHTEAVTAASTAGEGPLLMILAAGAVAYAIGFVRLRRGSISGRSVHARRAGLFAAGWLSIAASLLSPLHGLGLRSFTAHMIEHEILMLLAAPLFAISHPVGVLLWALPPAARKRAGGISRNGCYAAAWAALSAPVAATVLQAVLLWLWHVPALFDRALVSEGWHVAQHASILLSATLFWWSIERASSRAGRHGVAGLLLFVTAMQSGLLGALMAFSGSPWYAQYAALGLEGILADPLQDQQMAGFIMWIPGGAVHAAAAIYFLKRWFDEGEGTAGRQPGGVRALRSSMK